MTATLKTTRKISAHYIYYRRSFLRNGIVSLSSDGTITDISAPGDPDSIAGVEFYSGLLVPGFVNSHCHLELSYLKGAIPPSGGYIGFAKGMGEKREDFTLQERLSSLSAADASLWAQGVSAVGDICNGTTSFAAKAGSNIRYHNFLELFGLGSDLDKSLGPVAHDAEKYGLAYSSTPHSTYSLEDDSFTQAVEGFGNGVHKNGKTPPLSIHFMESPEEELLFHEQGDLWNWYRERGLKPGFPQKYGSPAERIISLVPRDRDILLIHNCCVTVEDIERLHDHFTGKVTWVLCPRSNRYITGLKPPVELLRSKGARIAIGTDSLASNTSLGILEELKEFRDIELAELLEWATVGGAEALGTDMDLGNMEVGSKPGLAIITGINWNDFSLTPDARSERIF